MQPRFLLILCIFYSARIYAPASAIPLESTAGQAATNTPTPSGSASGSATPSTAPSPGNPASASGASTNSPTPSLITAPASNATAGNTSNLVADLLSPTRNNVTVTANVTSTSASSDNMYNNDEDVIVAQLPLSITQGMSNSSNSNASNVSSISNATNKTNVSSISVASNKSNVTSISNATNKTNASSISVASSKSNVTIASNASNISNISVSANSTNATKKKTVKPAPAPPPALSLSQQSMASLLADLTADDYSSQHASDAAKSTASGYQPMVASLSNPTATNLNNTDLIGIPGLFNDHDVVALAFVVNDRYLSRCEGCLGKEWSNPASAGDSFIPVYETVVATQARSPLPTDMWRVEFQGNDTTRVRFRGDNGRYLSYSPYLAGSGEPKVSISSLAVDLLVASNETIWTIVRDADNPKRFALQGNSGQIISFCTTCNLGGETYGNAVVAQQYAASAKWPNAYFRAEVVQWSTPETLPPRLSNGFLAPFRDNDTVSIGFAAGYMLRWCDGCLNELPNTPAALLQPVDLAMTERWTVSFLGSQLQFKSSNSTYLGMAPTMVGDGYPLRTNLTKSDPLTLWSIDVDSESAFILVMKPSAANSLTQTYVIAPCPTCGSINPAKLSNNKDSQAVGLIPLTNDTTVARVTFSNDNLGGNLRGKVSAVSAANNTIDVFARGIDDFLWQISFVDGVWGRWKPIPDSKHIKIVSSPSCLSMGNDRIECFAAGDERQFLLQRSFGNGTWSDWTELDGDFTLQSGQVFGTPTCFSASPGTIDCLVLGIANSLWRRSYRNGAWGSYTLDPQRVSTSPSCAVLSVNNTACFVQGLYGQAILYKQILGDSETTWENILGMATDEVTAVAMSPTHVKCMLRNVYNTISSKSLVGGTWQNWTEIDLALYYPVAGVRRGTTNILDLFTVSKIGDLEHHVTIGS